MNPAAANSDALEALRTEFALRGRWPVLLLSAAGFGLSAALLGTAQPAWRLALGLWLAYVIGYGLLAALGRAGRRAWPWSGALAASALCTVIGAAAGLSAESALGEPPPGQGLARAGLYLGFVGLLLMLPLAQAALRQRALRLVEADRARTRAELQMLQAQIEPHFLFNTLATLRSLVRQQSEQALPLLDRMTAFLEAVLPQVRAPESTLQRELDIVEHYLAIMALRLAPRLRYRIECAPELGDLSLPPLLLQPLVENAVLHGIEPCDTGGEILVQALVQGQTLQLRVINTGAPLSSAGTSTGQGLALQNLRQRLQALYGIEARFALEAHAGATQALIELPLAHTQHP